MKEPYVSSVVYDMTGGLQPAPSDDGYNIVMPVYTPTGPCAKTKVKSQKEFIDKYLTGTKVTPSDDISVMMAYMTLAQNPLYVVRACPQTVLEGIGCTGRHYLFNKEHKLLNSYSEFGIDNIKINTDESQTYVVKQEDTTISDSGTNLDDVVSSVKKKTQSLVDNTSIDIINSGNQKITSRQELDLGSNVAVINTITQNSVYDVVSATANSSSSATLGEGSTVSINGTTYYFRGKNEIDSSSMINPTPITLKNNSEEIDPIIFLYLIQEKSGCDHAANGINLQLKKGDDNLTVKKSGSSLSSFPLTLNTMDTNAITTDMIEENSVDFNKDDTITISSNSITNGSNSISNFYLIQDSSSNNHSFVYLTETTEGIVFTCVGVKEENTTTKVTGSLKLIVSSYEDFNKAFIKSWIGLSADLAVRATGSMKLFIPKSNNLIVNASGLTVSSDGLNDKTYYYFVASNENNAKLFEHDFLYIKINDVLYFTNKEAGLPTSQPLVAETIVQMKIGKCNEIEFKSLLQKYTYEQQSLSLVNDYFVSTSAISSITHSAEIELKKNGNAEVWVVDQTSHSEQFAVVQNFPSTVASFQYSYDLDEDSVDTQGSIYDLSLKVKGGEITENWTISFDSGKVDGYGVDQWYTRVQSDYFTIVSLTDDSEHGEILNHFNSDTWGNAVSVPSFDAQFAINALQAVINSEDGVQYDVISDGGIVNTSLASAIESLADQLHSVYLASLPPKELNIESLKAYVGGAGLQSYETRMLAAGDRININGFSVVLPGSYKLLLQYINLYRNKATEFAPNFNIMNGSVGVSNLVQKWDKEQRESLLDAKIESLKGGVTTDWYINDNVTAQKQKSYMSEDQNVRMTNTAIHLCENEAKQYIGQLNTASLRESVTNNLTKVIQDRLFKGHDKYSPAQYKVVCDDTNNPSTVINANQLVISLYGSFTPSVKYVLLEHFIQPLSF